MINKFLLFSDRGKTKIILPLMIMSILIFTPLADVPGIYMFLVTPNLGFLLPFLIPLTLVMPFLYESKKGFFLYLFFIINGWNILMLSFSTINAFSIINMAEPILILSIVSFFVSILLSAYLIMENKSLKERAI